MCAQEALNWYNVEDWGVEGKGWKDTPRYYTRLPQKAKKTVTETIWKMGFTPTGLNALFETDATQIHARWKMRLQMGTEVMSRAAFSGVDLYGFEKGEWRWAGVGYPKEPADLKPNMLLAEELDGKRRKYRLYLPLRNHLDRVEIGIPKGAYFKPIAPRKEKPVVYYGSSIVHGAFASRPGRVFASILGRRVDRPLINLGFSGQAKMEPFMVDLISELDAQVYVIDALPNMDPPLVRERAEKFLTALCTARPKTPVLLVEDFLQSNAWIKPKLMSAHLEKWREFEKIYRILLKRGFKNLHLIKGKNLLGTDWDGTLDSIHPNDAGYMRLADGISPTLKALCKK